MRKLLRIIVLLGLLTVVGTLWFYVVEGWSLLDAVYMTVITLSTVGFEEVRPVSNNGRVFLIFFLVVGLGVFLYAVVQLGEMVMRAELRSWWRKRGMHSTLKTLKDHYIVCGFGRMGRAVCRHLSDRRLPFVVIDHNETVAEECETLGWPAVCNDATHDETLHTAGVHAAKGLAAVLNDDADNLYVVLSARLLAPNLQIIARALDEDAARKMQKAGADRVVSLFATGAASVAQLLINPRLEGFSELVTAPGNTLDLAEIRVSADSPYASQTIARIDARKHGVLVVAVRRADGEILLPPPPATVVQPGDELIALGTVDAISKFLAADAQPSD